MRIVWAVCGVVSVCLGALGVLLPLLPTVPFMLLAAFCFARSSPQMHDWLLAHRVFGPAIVDWRENGAISLRGKRLATVSIAVVFAISLALQIRPLLLAVQATVLGAVLVFIWSRPHSRRTEAGRSGRAGPGSDSGS